VTFDISSETSHRVQLPLESQVLPERVFRSETSALQGQDQSTNNVVLHASSQYGSAETPKAGLAPPVTAQALATTVVSSDPLHRITKIKNKITPMQKRDGGRKKKSGKIHPTDMVDQLDSALQSDSTVSRTFKWKSSRLLHELRQLFAMEKGRRNKSVTPVAVESVHPNSFTTLEVLRLSPSLMASDVAPSLEIEELNSLTPKDMTSSYSAAKTYQCTYPDCMSAFASPVDWKRHEEKDKHWPQQRYMCLECPISVTDGLFQLFCSFCSMPYSSIDMLKPTISSASLHGSRGKPSLGKTNYPNTSRKTIHFRRNMRKTKLQHGTLP
jgi:hypothetical protein